MVSRLKVKMYDDVLIPEFRIIAKKKTKKEKRMAKIVQKVVDYQWMQAQKSKIVNTPWGTLMWTPKGELID